MSAESPSSHTTSTGPQYATVSMSAQRRPCKAGAMHYPNYTPYIHVLNCGASEPTMQHLVLPDLLARGHQQQCEVGAKEPNSTYTSKSNPTQASRQGANCTKTRGDCSKHTTRGRTWEERYRSCTVSTAWYRTRYSNNTRRSQCCPIKHVSSHKHTTVPIEKGALEPQAMPSKTKRHRLPKQRACCQRAAPTLALLHACCTTSAQSITVAATHPAQNTPYPGAPSRP
jgi:hypothetical protein